MHSYGFLETEMTLRDDINSCISISQMKLGEVILKISY